jgi:tetratricopeptide (TPR) repeat protein
MANTPSQKKIQYNVKRAHSLADAGKFEDSARLCSQLLQAVDSPYIANLLGLNLLNMGKHEHAERVWETALEDDPDCVPVLTNLANFLRERHRFKRASELIDHALRCKPDDFRANHNKAVLELNMGEVDVGLDYAEKAYAMNPDEIAARHTLSIASLGAGQFERGFDLYEARKPLFLRDDSPLPKYTGGKGKVIVRHEQGFGDTLMVMRLLPRLQELGADVYIVCPRPLQRLIEQTGLCKLHEDGVDDYTHHLWTMDLMGLFVREWSDWDDKPYINASLENRAHWGSLLGGCEGGQKIGLCYGGAARSDSIGAYQIDRRRSLAPSEAMQIVRSKPDAHWVNLSREWGLPDTIDFGTRVGDFADLAGLISNLDLVITVDTAVAHLAGGLGVPTWMLSRYDACFRWWPYQETTNLYRSVRCFYQPKMFDWQSVIADVQKNLNKM